MATFPSPSFFGTEPGQFEFTWPGQAVFGTGSVERLALWAMASNARSLLVLSDPGLVGAGIVSQYLDALRAAGITAHLFDGVEANPTLDNVAQALSLWELGRCEALVAIGGGRVIDVGKILLATMCSDKPVEQVLLEGDQAITRPVPHFAALPTTAGTGSESTTAALIKDHEHRKHVMRSRKARPQWIALDPELTLSVPPQVTACTGFDTVTHALGAALNRTTNPAGEALALQALSLSMRALPRVLTEPHSLQARSDMLLGSYLAGVAMSLRGVDGIHGLCTPIESLVDRPHAHVLAVTCIPLMRFTLPAAVARYAHVARSCGVASIHGNDEEAGLALIDAIDALRRKAGLPCTLAELGVHADQLPPVVDLAASNPSLRLNARQPSRDEIVQLYQAMQPG